MNQYLPCKMQGVTHDPWKQEVVDKLAEEILGLIKDHWKASSKTRKLFIAMNKAEVWEDEKEHKMHLTKRNLATLDPKFIPDLQQHVLRELTSRIEVLRSEAAAIIQAIYPTEEEAQAPQSVLLGTNDEDYSFDRYREHLDLQIQLRKEFQNKFAVIEALRQREIFVQRLVAFEQAHLNSTDLGKGQKNLNRWLPTFRTSATKVLLKSNSDAHSWIKQYESSTGKTFLLKGIRYETEFLAKQEGQIARVKTNLRGLTADVLYFDNPEMLSESEGNTIVGTILDPVLQPLLAGAVPVPDPPPMPEFSAELEFAFEYY